MTSAMTHSPLNYGRTRRPPRPSKWTVLRVALWAIVVSMLTLIAWWTVMILRDPHYLD